MTLINSKYIPIADVPHPSLLVTSHWVVLNWVTAGRLNIVCWCLEVLQTQPSGSQPLSGALDDRVHSAVLTAIGTRYELSRYYMQVTYYWGVRPSVKVARILFRVYPHLFALISHISANNRIV